MEADNAARDRGKVTPRFQKVRRIGEGAAGYVFLVHDAQGCQYAMKTLRPEAYENKALAQRFVREMRICTIVEHPNVVRTVEVGLSPDGSPYIVCEFCPGGSLYDELVRSGPVEPRQAMTWFIQIAEAVDHIWRNHKIIHRDIKPENILLDEHRNAKLGDLGLARRTIAESIALTTDGMVMGTPYYMPPEQAEGLDVLDTRADLFSLGATFYHLLSGTTLFTGSTPIEILVKMMKEVPRPLDHVRPGLPPDLVRIVHRLIEKDRDDRPADPAELLRELRSVAEGLSASDSSAMGTMIQDWGQDGGVTMTDLIAASALPGAKETCPRFACVGNGSSSWPVPRAHLRVTDSPSGVQWEAALYAQSEVTFGRSPAGEATLPLRVYPIESHLTECKKISSRHGLFSATASGWQVTDLGSRNGLELSGRRLESDVPEPIACQSVLSVGNALRLKCIPLARSLPRQVEVDGATRVMSDAPALVMTRLGNRSDLLYAILRDRLQIGGEEGQGLAPPGTSHPNAGAIWWFEGQFFWEARVASLVNGQTAHAGQLVAIPQFGIVRAGLLEITFGALTAGLFD